MYTCHEHKSQISSLRFCLPEISIFKRATCKARGFKIQNASRKFAHIKLTLLPSILTIRIVKFTLLYREGSPEGKIREITSVVLAALTREILYSPLEDKLYIFAPPYIILYIFVKVYYSEHSFWMF
jgi:hypothetical protein